MRLTRPDRLAIPGTCIVAGRAEQAWRPARLTRLRAGVVCRVSGESWQGTERLLALQTARRGDPLNLIRVMPAKGENRVPSTAGPLFHRRPAGPCGSACVQLIVNGEE